MRVLASLRWLLLAVFVAIPFGLRAQFQEPTKEELQMTADPKAPGAAAVYLNYQEVTDDPLHYRMTYARIKVLSEKGKSLATVEVPTWGDSKITDVHARTIHSDGTVIPLDVKPEQLFAGNEGGVKVHVAAFNLPSAEVGSILEYRYQERYDDEHYRSPMWQIQHPYFVHKAHYGFTPFKSFQKGANAVTSQFLVDEHGNAANTLMWWPRLPDGVEMKRDELGRFSIDLEDIPPVPDEAWMPPIRSILYQVLFYYKSAFNAKDFWNDEAKRWSKEVDHFAEPNRPIQAAAASIIAPGDSDLDKARKLYKAVQALENTDYTREKGKAELKQLHIRQQKRAEDTWAQKSGSRQDIALLYLAMLRAAGLTAYDMKVVNRDRALFSPQYLWWDQLEDDIIILSSAGKDIYLDPGEKMCPFQTVHWKHSGAGGIRQGTEGRSVAVTPLAPYNVNSVTRVGDVTLNADGTVKGSIRFILAGQEALYWRQQSLLKDPDDLKKEFDRHFQEVFPDGVEGHVDHFLGIDDPDNNLLAMINVEGSIGTATSKRFLLPGFFFASHGQHLFVNEEKRQSPVDMHYADRVTDQVTYHLPPGLQVEATPQDSKVAWADQAVLITKSVNKPGEVTIARQFSRGFTFVEAAKYQDLRSFYQKVAQSDQQQVVLTVAPAVAQKGN